MRGVCCPSGGSRKCRWPSRCTPRRAVRVQWVHWIWCWCWTCRSTSCSWSRPGRWTAGSWGTSRTRWRSPRCCWRTPGAGRPRRSSKRVKNWATAPTDSATASPPPQRNCSPHWRTSAGWLAGWRSWLPTRASVKAGCTTRFWATKWFFRAGQTLHCC